MLNRSSLLLAGMLALGGCGAASNSGSTPSDSQSGVAAASAVEQTIDGQQIYERSCINCHAFGAAGAPKTGDKEAWQVHLAKGRDVLLSSTRNGLPPGMPAKGLCVTCSDAELAAALDYMLSQVQ